MNTASVRARLLAVRREVDDVLKELETEEQVKPIARAMSVPDYAKHRAVSPRTVKRWIKLGLPVERIGKITRVIVAKADAWDEKKSIKRNAELTVSGGHQ